MSIEANIAELTAAVRELTAAIGKVQAPGLVNAQEQSEKKLQNVVASASKPATSANGMPQNSGQSDKAPNEQPKSSPDSTTSQPSSAKSVEVSYDEVKAAILDVSKKSRSTPQESREQAEALLARFGVQKISQLAVSQYADAAAYAKRVMEGLDATTAEVSG